MGNNPIKFIDPDGGCVDKDGNLCSHGDIGSISIDGGGNQWTWDGETFNTNFSFGLSEVIISNNPDVNLLLSNTWTTGGSQYYTNGAYQFDVTDLRMAIKLLNGPDSPIKTGLRRILASGNPEPLTGANYWNYYGHTLGTLKNSQTYIEYGASLGSGAFGGGQLRTNATYNGRGKLGLTVKPLKDHQSLINKTDLYHNYPKLYERHLIKHGRWSQRIIDRANWYELDGSINGRNGTYELGVNSNNIIYHRNFVPFKK